MKKYNVFFPLVFLFIFGCSAPVSKEPDEIHWDRDMCQRCKMLISDIHYAAQVINPKNGQKYFFDDIGCVVLWFKENKNKWEDSSVLWVKEATTSMWLDAKKAFFSTKDITPMGYGFGAHGNTKDNFIKFEEMRLRMLRGEHMANKYIESRAKD